MTNTTEYFPNSFVFNVKRSCVFVELNLNKLEKCALPEPDKIHTENEWRQLAIHFRRHSLQSAWLRKHRQPQHSDATRVAYPHVLRGLQQTVTEHRIIAFQLAREYAKRSKWSRDSYLGSLGLVIPPRRFKSSLTVFSSFSTEYMRIVSHRATIPA